MGHARMILIASLVITLGSSQADAGLGKWIAKGVRSIGRKVGLVGKEGAKAGLKKSATAAPTIVRKTASEVGASVARGTANQAARSAASVGTTSLSTVSRSLGRAGAAAMVKLSPSAGKKMAEVAPLIAKSPHKEKWLSLLRTHGDDCAEFLWKHRKSVAVASIGTGMALHPDAFTKMVSSGVESAGSHVIEPMITGVSRDVVKPMLESAVATPGKSGLSIWGWSLFNGLLLGGFVWWRARRK